MSSTSGKLVKPLPFECSTSIVDGSINNPFINRPPDIAIQAADDLKKYLSGQLDWKHNFGMQDYTVGRPAGKMFGVLVVKEANGNLGYLSAFSGKLAGKNHHPGFVPPIYDSLSKDGFLNQGMTNLGALSKRISALYSENDLSKDEEVRILELERKELSVNLQKRLHDSYVFSNAKGMRMSLRQLFHKSNGGNPPSAAGECAAPKLLQFAYTNGLRPVAIAEFWWGANTRSEHFEHGAFYPACSDKCPPILSFMLQGLNY